MTAILTCIDSRIIAPTKLYARFELGSFAPGQALTVANGLRRALLSELYGVNIVFVEIPGVSHEYASIVGVRECVLDLLLNLKQIVLKSEFKIFTPQVGRLNVKGPGKVYARDLKLPFFVSVVDPDQYIATLSETGQLNIQYVINCGKTYMVVDPLSKTHTKFKELLRNKKISNKNVRTKNIYKTWKKQRNEILKPHLKTNIEQSQQIKQQMTKLAKLKKLKIAQLKQMAGDLPKPIIQKTPSTKQTLIPNSIPIIKNQPINSQPSYFSIDAIFSPVYKVTFCIELKNQLKNPKKQYETIVLELWTNGSINPKRAIHETFKSLIKLFKPFQQPKSTFYLTLPKRKIKKNTSYKDLSAITKIKNMLFNLQIEKSDSIQLIESTIKKRKHLKLLLKILKQRTKNSEFINDDLNKIIDSSQLNKPIVTPNLIKKKLSEQKKNSLFIENQIESDNTLNIHQQFRFQQLKKRLQKIKKLQLKFLFLDLLNLDLDSHVYLSLKQAKIHTIGQLMIMKKSQLLKLQNFNIDILNHLELKIQIYLSTIAQSVKR